MHAPSPGAGPAQAPPPREVWCDEHYRPLGPDGTCPECAQGDDPTRSERRVVLVIVAIALLGGIGPAAYYFFWARHTEDRNPGVKAGGSTERVQRKTPPMARKERWVDEVVPPTDVVEEPPRRREVTTRKDRANRRARRGSSRGRRPRVATAPTAPRAAVRVPIIMYMAHW